MQISVIIPTYKRYHTLNKLIAQLNELGDFVFEIIVVDSTDIQDRKSIFPSEKLNYLTSVHKNGLFQRYQGFLVAKCEWLLFLDNDMELIDPGIADIFEKIAKQKDTSGIAFKIENKHSNTSISEVPKSILFVKNKRIKNIINWFTGYPSLKPGKLGLCAVRGEQPLNGAETEWLGGGAFAAKRDSIFVNFNFQLVDLFEKRLGMGEDALLGYGLSKIGKLIYCDELLFLHNDQKDSAYSANHFQYGCRVIFSRLYLSLEKTRIGGGSYLFAYIHYHWYVLWRIIGLRINLAVKKNEINSAILEGSLKGWKLALKFKYKMISRISF